MLKKFLKEEGTKKLTKEEQKTIQGGSGPCPPNQVYWGHKCWDKVPD